MKVLKLLGKLLAFLAAMLLTVLQLMLTYVVGFSAWVFNLNGGNMLAVCILEVN